jgi:chemotaxis protein CheX
MEPKYIQPFLTATTKVLKTMAFTVPKAGEYYIKTDKKTMGDISGIIGFTGAKQGALVVSFSNACALKVVSAMLMEDYTEVNEEIYDAVGEITNMISGDARQQLEKLGMKFEAGIPTVVTGKGHKIRFKRNGPCHCHVIPFTCDGLEFFVEASFES